jgi:hypothetical protein
MAIDQRSDMQGADNLWGLRSDADGGSACCGPSDSDDRQRQGDVSNPVAEYANGSCCYKASEQ